MKGRIGEEEMKRRLELFLIILLPILGLVFLGGKIMTLTKRPEQKITTSSSKKVVQKSEEEIKKEQIAFLKEHEKEIVDFVKTQNPKIESVQIDWNSMQIEESGNGTPQGGGYNLSISGKINQLKNTKFSVDFYLEDQNSIPTIKKMGMLNDIYIEENGGWKIFS
ncbi:MULTISPECIES: hypothetical protein [Streptococcus]|uniref:hypothetical protein n=1 Tax=Streptococcus TaxID=1301 RepID=UPI00066E2C7C|nr:hypothetical protein [Streptococcus parasanguinis]MCP8990371.1 hypothetical protein [Streptococcus parasanguinis]MCP8992066.1 hypothetical protein [Streptococcus parasanguinis]MCP9003157.1 hypothetical protein [Streptococcus parasanguinis]MCP9009421.1 hypothetical protein [Streptococcus parasanguinis]MCP9033646.1 hypothetical protein [Streptococcus parasanguinis]